MKLASIAKAPWSLFSRAWRETRSHLLTARVSKGIPDARIVVADALLPVTLSIAKGGSFVLRGCLTLTPWHGGRERILIKVGENSNLTINGDFCVGPGCRLIVESGGELRIGGARNERGSGITERSLIMVRRRIIIGSDLICAWGTYITDCDWHEVVGLPNTEETNR